MKIRKATISDAESLSRVHYEAVHGEMPGNFYTHQTLCSWAPSPTDEFRLTQLRSSIQDENKLVVVAELGDDNTIIGFGTVTVTENVLRALYVDPKYGNQGVGTTILKYLEEYVAQHGSSMLQLNASLNAQTFYIRHGYSIISPAYHRLSSGEQMKCVLMGKSLLMN